MAKRKSGDIIGESREDMPRVEKRRLKLFRLPLKRQEVVVVTMSGDVVWRGALPTDAWRLPDFRLAPFVLTELHRANVDRDPLKQITLVSGQEIIKSSSRCVSLRRVENIMLQVIFRSALEVVGGLSCVQLSKIHSSPHNLLTAHMQELSSESKSLAFVITSEYDTQIMLMLTDHWVDAKPTSAPHRLRYRLWWGDHPVWMYYAYYSAGTWHRIIHGDLTCRRYINQRAEACDGDKSGSRAQHPAWVPLSRFYGPSWLVWPDQHRVSPHAKFAHDSENSDHLPEQSAELGFGADFDDNLPICNTYTGQKDCLHGLHTHTIKAAPALLPRAGLRL